MPHEFQQCVHGSVSLRILNARQFAGIFFSDTCRSTRRQPSTRGVYMVRTEDDLKQ